MEPSLAERHHRIGGFTAPFTVVRLLTPLTMTYEAAKKRAEPYTKIVETLPEMRRETITLVKQAIGENRRAYVLVNNRSEGNAPLTVQAIMDPLSCTACGRTPRDRAMAPRSRERPSMRERSAWRGR